jgi:hypothetical protein
MELRSRLFREEAVRHYETRGVLPSLDSFSTPRLLPAVVLLVVAIGLLVLLIVSVRTSLIQPPTVLTGADRPTNEEGTTAIQLRGHRITSASSPQHGDSALIFRSGRQYPIRVMLDEAR